jgi:hypothetical protein
VISIIKKDHKAAGVKLSNGSKKNSKVVINLAGPISHKLTKLAQG